MRTLNIELTEEEYVEIGGLLQDKQDGVWCDESWPIHFANLIANAMLRNKK
jgi:hypothetical protein